MKTVVCFGDSNTWGHIPVTGHRLPCQKRWTGIMAEILGNDYKVEEEGVNGRTTCFDDPMYPKRCGTEFFEEVLLTNYPVDLVIIMLGTNDSKVHLRQTPYSVAAGMERLIKIAQNPEYGPEYGLDGAAPKILIASPAHINPNIVNLGLCHDFDLNSVALVNALAPLYKELAEKYGCGFIDASLFTTASERDCLHITEESHAKLARAMAEKVKELIG